MLWNKQDEKEATFVALNTEAIGKACAFEMTFTELCVLYLCFGVLAQIEPNLVS